MSSPPRLPLDPRRSALEEAARRAVALGTREMLRTQAARYRRRTGPALPPGSLDPAAAPPDRGLLQRIGPVEALRLGVLPWRRIGGETVILAPDIAAFTRARAPVEAALGPCRPALASAGAIEAALLALAGPALAHRAETLAPDRDSCRGLSGPATRRTGLTVLGAGLGAALLAPGALVAALTCLSVFFLVTWTALRCAGLWLSARPAPGPDTSNVSVLSLPRMTLLVPLFRERRIAEDLLARLHRLSYPRDRLQVLLLLEDNDDQTRTVIEAADLPPWIRRVSVPEGTIRTKPRALNHGLVLATGDILGIYDAEDAPAPDQLLRVAERFAQRPRRVACLQGRLDIFNDRASWITRCFALDYAAWFRIILPTLARLGLPLPLGGTTLFLRRDVLEEIGGWDAHNVTEDADLGLRLYRRGYRTELVDTVTEEEATAGALRWMRQRSRWQKGYAVTWLVHMRRPRALWRDVGPAGFLAVQALLFGTLLQAAAAPLLWAIWLTPLGLPHPLAPVLGAAGLWTLAGAFLLCEIALLASVWRGAALAGKGRLWPWALTLPAYFALATLSVCKALAELVWAPFFWDKTDHGLTGGSATPVGPQSSDCTFLASSRSRTTKAAEM